MSRAIGWLLIIVVVIMLGTHPAVLGGLIQQAFAVLGHAAHELLAFASKL